MKYVCVICLMCLLLVRPVYTQSEKQTLKIAMSALFMFRNSQGFASTNSGIPIAQTVGYFRIKNADFNRNFAFAALGGIPLGLVPSSDIFYVAVLMVKQHASNNKKFLFLAKAGFGLDIKTDTTHSAGLRYTSYDDINVSFSTLTSGLGCNYYFNEKFRVKVSLPCISRKNTTVENTFSLFKKFGLTIG